MRSVVYTFAMAAAVAFGSSCNKPQITPWLGIPSAIATVVEVVHDATGRALGRNDVSVEAGEVHAAGAGFVADMKLTVSDGDNRFSTTAEDVPCDQDGIPTDESVDKIRQAAEEIKAKIKRFQL